jgi:hypothetical protein
VNDCGRLSVIGEARWGGSNAIDGSFGWLEDVNEKLNAQKVNIFPFVQKPATFDR